MARKAKKSGYSQIENLYLRVLGYLTKEGYWAAHCLETDIVGYGKSFEIALGDLMELTEMQISFAVFKNQPALLDRPAPPDIIEMYQAVYRNTLSRFNSSTFVDPKRTVTSIPWPQVTKKTESSFVPA